MGEIILVVVIATVAAVVGIRFGIVIARNGLQRLVDRDVDGEQSPEEDRGG